MFCIGIFLHRRFELVHWIMPKCECKAIVETPRQVYLILGVSVVMGAAFGFIFGFLDVEDASRGWNLRQALINEEKYCYPLGLVLGAFAAVFNDRLGRNDTDYDPISQHDHFDDDDF